ncbi:ribonuclease H-like [Ambystoma mexicanum]|uniref:ribonuclease H-like n=1 Tax=Ambystoma mexicanum TaxID=8296 RepID=UPI0037E878AB
MHKVYEEDKCEGIPTVYVDGWSYHVDNNGEKELVAGIGNAWMNDAREPSDGYKIGPGSSQVAELMAVHQAIFTSVQHKLHKLVIITDSVYVRNGFMEHRVNWKTKGMLCANNKPIKHGKLIENIDDLVTSNGMTINWKKIKGHSRIQGTNKTRNDQAGQLAKTVAIQGDLLEIASLLGEIQVTAVTRF